MRHNPVAGESPTPSRPERTFLSMRPWLPRDAENFLDIGCGLGGVAMWTTRHFPRATAHLIDGEMQSQKWVSYQDGGQAWADVHIAVRLYAKHCPGREVRSWPPDPAQVTIPPCELIFSNCSWGHHYPIETYLDLVRRTLLPAGVLIVDLRKGDIGSHGADVLSRHFSRTGTIDVGEKKYIRSVWRHN